MAATPNSIRAELLIQLPGQAPASIGTITIPLRFDQMGDAHEKLTATVEWKAAKAVGQLEELVVAQAAQIADLQHCALALSGQQCVADCCAPTEAAKRERAALNQACAERRQR
ncbi:hypothetical protein [Nocardia farcinica]|uniref:hypothetical protein n=1 Tax=Nocardia farcinica TaxID=37329 RepID=UPI0018933197|nr:hypothetical protein [Nocardia farcinica]MBF6374472.1 hypothetical protein [Nocardia farcinica]